MGCSAAEQAKITSEVLRESNIIPAGLSKAEMFPRDGWLVVVHSGAAENSQPSLNDTRAELTAK